MTVRVRAKVDIGRAEKKVSQDNMVKGQIALAGQIVDDSEPYVPFRDGDLRGNVSIAGDGSNITYGMVYARAQYYGTNGKQVFRKYSNGGGKKWYLKAKRAHLENWKKVSRNAMGLK